LRNHGVTASQKYLTPVVTPFAILKLSSQKISLSLPFGMTFPFAGPDNGIVIGHKRTPGKVSKTRLELKF
jgi:hypothetical protein